MMTTRVRGGNGPTSDSSLWQLVCEGSTAAFEELVRRYQSLVCSVAYSVCGNLALSEDVAQETFWTAWRQRASLEQPDRLNSWLCGIARNLAKNALRKASRAADSAEADDTLAALTTGEPGPAEEAVSREEETIVWQALERIPETYREPLILFYREDKSINQIAGALDLKVDTVKQRLSRGRGMLRERVAELVEGGLRRSRPGSRFTLTVMAGLAAHTAASKTALAGAGAAAWKAAAGVTAGGSAGVLGGLLGTLGGLAGSWLGAWVPAQAAPTRRERHAYLAAGRRTLVASVVFIAVLFGMIHVFAGKPSYLLAWGAWLVAYWAYLGVECFRLGRAVKRLRSDPGPDDLPNDTALRAGWTAMAKRFGDRVYRSEATLLGLPLVDIHLSAPMPPEARTLGGDIASPSARGWIAIGDDARGILLAIGGTARGLVAVGGRAVGAVSFGGLAVGLVAFGGLGLGVLGIGGLGVGAYAIGGGAIGWRAAGGLAVGWDIACGGGAFARHAAMGGAAVATDFAVGGQAHARHANDQEARDFVLGHPFTRLAFTVLGQPQVLSQVAAVGQGRKGTAAFRLENGLAVRIQPIQGTRSVALLVLYRVGGDHDPRGQSGLAHLVEHLYVTAAAGGEPVRTADAFFRRYKAGCNAQTGDRYTIIATVFPREDLDNELKDAAARMGSLRITPADLDREKPRLRDELANMFGGIPALGAVNVARELIRPTPRGGRKGGVPDHVATITLDDVRQRWKRYYKPGNAILVVAGAVDEATTSRAVRAHFAPIEPGEQVPGPGLPGLPETGVVRTRTVHSIQSQAQPAACLAYAAPEPGSEAYASFLVLVARLFGSLDQAGVNGGTSRPSVYFPLLEDPAVLGVSTAAKPGEAAPQTIARLESFVAATIAPTLRDGEPAAARQMFALFLGTAEIADSALAQNLYGVALSLARREQLGIDPLTLGRAFDDLTEQALRRTAAQVFPRARQAGAFVVPGE